MEPVPSRPVSQPFFEPFGRFAQRLINAFVVAQVPGLLGVDLLPGKGGLDPGMEQFVRVDQAKGQPRGKAVFVPVALKNCAGMAMPRPASGSGAIHAASGKITATTPICFNAISNIRPIQLSQALARFQQNQVHKCLCPPFYRPNAGNAR